MIIVRTPLRLSFVGGGSDINFFYEKKDGMVISCAMDKFVYVIVKERFDDKIYINYSMRKEWGTLLPYDLMDYLFGGTLLTPVK